MILRWQVMLNALSKFAILEWKWAVTWWESGASRRVFNVPALLLIFRGEQNYICICDREPSSNWQWQGRTANWNLWSHENLLTQLGMITQYLGPDRHWPINSIPKSTVMSIIYFICTSNLPSSKWITFHSNTHYSSVANLTFYCHVWQYVLINFLPATCLFVITAILCC